MIKLNIDLSIFNSSYIKDNNLFDYSQRWNIYYGGAGSGKSRFIIQKLILKALKYKNVRFLFCRRYGSTLLNSVMKETKLVLNQFGITDYCKISDYNREYILPNGSSIIFMGLDDEDD